MISKSARPLRFEVGPRAGQAGRSPESRGPRGTGVPVAHAPEPALAGTRRRGGVRPGAGPASGGARCAGHDVDTVADEDLLSQPDPVIGRAAKDADRVLLTLDVEFADLRKYPPGTHPGIVLFRPACRSIRATSEMVLSFAPRLEEIDPSRCVVVVDEECASGAHPSERSASDVRATSRPRLDTPSQKRMAARTHEGSSSSHEPPRSTRIVPSVGPVGFLAGPVIFW
jgi:hypothetical protein